MQSLEIPETKIFEVMTKTGRKFPVHWVRKDSELKPSFKGNYIQDTFVFETMKDFHEFAKTKFFEDNGFEVGCAFIKLYPGCKCTYFVTGAECEKRVRNNQFGPRGIN